MILREIDTATAQNKEFPSNSWGKNWSPAIVCFVFSFVFLTILTFSPSGKQQLAVIYPFGMAPEKSFFLTIDAGGYVTGEGWLENIVLFTPGDGENSDEIISKLYNNGALAVINSTGAGGCFRISPPAVK